MPASVLKKILAGVWRRLGPWRMKKCEDGIMGFFFEEEEDYAFVMDKRPWLVNGVLLNLKPRPVEGEVRVAEFEVARGVTRLIIEESIPKWDQHRKGRTGTWKRRPAVVKATDEKDKGKETQPFWGKPTGDTPLQEQGTKDKFDRGSGAKLEVEGKQVAIRHLQFSLIQALQGDSAWLGKEASIANLWKVSKLASKLEFMRRWDHWVLMGDLNATLEETEKEGGRNFDRKDGEFLANFLFEIGGVDLGCGSGMTTWQNSRSSCKRIRKRLDRVVASALWCTEFPKACVEKFPIIGSDHAPILLNAWGEGPKLRYPFCFLELLISRPACEKALSKIDNDFDKLFVEKVTNAENEEIGRIPRDSEIKEVVFKLHPLKAPGPDGYPRIFFQKYWHIVGKEVCEMVIVRLLTDHLKGVMDRLVSPYQSAFIPGRWIAECTIMAQEVLHSMKNKKGKKGVMAIKTNMNKPYDQMEWGFISRVLKANGFNNHVCKLIIQCITTEEKNGGITGIRVARNAMPISYLFYVDDAMFFSQASATSKRKDYYFIKEKIQGRLEGWKAKHLSQVGRTTLIGSVLQSILNYFMSTVQVPQTLCDELDKILARFWWIGNKERKHYQAYKSWNEICQPKGCGGLGLRRLNDMNEALLAKLFWMVMSEENKVWVKSFMAKYCIKIDPWEVDKGGNDSRSWKSILNVRKVCLEGAGILIADGDCELWNRPWIPGKNSDDIRDSFHFIPNQAFWKVKDLLLEGTRSWNETLIKASNR
uniref:Reverse transcriptase domain-containing protein n=1 Tax=Cannabis sativa TaxID=3483 RepID=A0A803PBK2_CANSA